MTLSNANLDIDLIRAWCLGKLATSECFPFDDTTLVFKVGTKMFALASLEDHPLTINLKCDPDLAVELRSRYSCVLPGYHMNKAMWNTIVLDGSVPATTIQEWIDLSYQLVVAKMTRKERDAISNSE